MSDVIRQSNELRRRIWELNDDLSNMLVVSPEFRNQNRIAQIEEQIVDLERQIEEIRGNSARG
jgi:hypothetical protein